VVAPSLLTGSPLTVLVLRIEQMEHVINNSDHSEAQPLLEGLVDAPGSGPLSAIDVVTEFHNEQATTNEFLFFEPKRPHPYGVSRTALIAAAKSRGIAALILLVVLTVTVVLVGTLSSWTHSMRWATWFTLFTLVALFVAMVLDLWDLSLTFFVAIMALGLANIITIEDALAGFR
jgi:ABC-type multidrug transport system fused ATPase/permease subunit